jgi:secreted trypsin-like serine protease
MKSWFNFQIALLIICLGISSLSYANHRRIIGGIDPTESYPWMVGIYNSQEIFCGGSLIDPYWVLTAAHCLDGIDPIFHNLEITTNQIKLNDFNNIEKIKIKRFIQHPLWDTNNYDSPNDIALLELEKPSTQKTISMVSTSENFNESRVLGFGTTSLTSNVMSNLKQLDLPIISNEICQAAYQGVYNLIDSQICAGFPEGQKDSCSGDSGSPLIVLENNQWKQLGVVSFGGKNGVDCAGENAYGVYTNIPKFKTQILDFINNKIQLTSEFKNNHFSLQLLEITNQNTPRTTVDLWVGVETAEQFYFIFGNAHTPQFSLQPRPFKENISPQEIQQLLLDLTFIEKMIGKFRFYAAYTLSGSGLDKIHSNIAQLTVEF